MKIRLNLSNAFNQKLSAVNSVDNPLDAAVCYASLGIFVLPKAKGRKDSNLKGWQGINCTDPKQIKRWYGTGYNDGVILKPSPVTLDDGQQTNLIWLDCDGQAVYDAVCTQFPMLCDTRTELTGSGNGYRIWLLTDKLPTVGKGKITRKGILGTDHLGFEIFFKTGAVVVAPSIHPETHKPYKLINDAPVLHVDSIDDVAEWALALPAKNDKKKRVNTRPISMGQGDVPSEVSAAIVRALGIEGYNADGWSPSLACIFHKHQHDPEKPAAAWNGQKNFFYCHKCGQSWNAKETATVLGIEWPKPPPRPKPPTQTINADLVVNTPYVSDHAAELPKTGGLFITSATATGKTELAKIITGDKSVISINPFKSLTYTSAQRLETEHYESIPHEYRASVGKMSICLPSIKKYAEATQRPKPAVLVLDEITRTLEMFSSREIFPGADATIVYSVLKNLVKDAETVLLTDAYQGDIELNWLRSIRSDVFTVVNTHKRNYGKLWIYPEYKQLLNTMNKAVEARQGAIVCVSTTKAEIERLEQFYAEKYGKDAVISIHSENATNKRQREFLKLIGDSSTEAAKQTAIAEMQRYRIILASPSLLTGVDIQPSVYRLFGVLHSNDIDAPGCMQLLHRYRNTEETHVWIEPKERNLPTNAETIYNRYRTAADRTQQLCALNDAYELDFDGILAEMLHLQAAIEARRNRSLNNLYESFLELAQPHYKIEMVSKDAPAANLNALKEASEAVKARFQQLTLTVASLSPEMHRDRSERGIRTDEDNAGLERWYIENLYCQPITEDLYNLWAGGKGASELYTFIDVMHKPETDLKAYDRQQITTGVPLHIRDHRAMKTRAIKHILFAIFGQRRNLTSDYQLFGGEITERFEAYANLHSDLLEDLSLYCGLSRNDASRKPLTIVKRVVRLMGWTLRQQGRPSKDTPEEERIYALDAKQMALMDSLAQTRLAAIAEKKLHEIGEEMQKKRRRYISSTAEVRHVAQKAPQSLPETTVWIPLKVGTGASKINPFSRVTAPADAAYG